MNRKPIQLSILLVLLFSCSVQETEHDLLHKKNPDGKYGEKISLKEFHDISDLLNFPD